MGKERGEGGGRKAEGRGWRNADPRRWDLSPAPPPSQGRWPPPPHACTLAAVWGVGAQWANVALGAASLSYIHGLLACVCVSRCFYAGGQSVSLCVRKEGGVGCCGTHTSACESHFGAGSRAPSAGKTEDFTSFPLPPPFPPPFPPLPASPPPFLCSFLLPLPLPSPLGESEVTPQRPCYSHS